MLNNQLSLTERIKTLPKGCVPKMIDDKGKQYNINMYSQEINIQIRLAI